MASVTEARPADAKTPVSIAAAGVTEAEPTVVEAAEAAVPAVAAAAVPAVAVTAEPAAPETAELAAPETAELAAPETAELAAPETPAIPQAGSMTVTVPARMREPVERTMEQATKTAEGLFKAAEEAAEFGRGNLEAVAKATQVYVAGVQDLGKQTFALVQGLADHTVAGAKALGSVKSLKEAADIQASYARAAMEKSFTETAKLQEAALKLAEASFAPISARMTLAVEKFSKPIAA
ncbi:phasin family protein [Paracraurococcus lichenis]|uniref:Phasin family protein n=1 Tax=Paracraurococcus lichenis TaxID=3064888 RepID=A0ABT9DTJ6_9PROT|nr:phasin family protein [Paracraurococcus sp. LOR1-02]MDO9707204.1 phasin family protein [Paracraurococcus sp. LOR1-02]